MFDNDFVYHQKGGKITSLGYTINNMLLEKGLPAFAQSGGGRGGSDLIIPAGLLLLQQTIQKQTDLEDLKVEKLEDVDVIDNSLYDKLLQLVSVKKPKQQRRTKRQTKRQIKKRKNKTRRR